MRKNETTEEATEEKAGVEGAEPEAIDTPSRAIVVFRDGREGCGLLKRDGAVIAKFFTEQDLQDLLAPFKAQKFEVTEEGPGAG